LALLSGCVPSDAATPPQPTPTFVAPYATDEEALAAAEEAYGEYVRVMREFYSEVPTDPAPIYEVASGEHLEDLLLEFDERAAKETYILGEQSFDQIVLQRYSHEGSTNEVIAVYLCDDLSGMSIYRHGEKIGPENPVLPSLTQVVFDFDENSDSLKVSARDLWESGSC